MIKHLNWLKIIIFKFNFALPYLKVKQYHNMHILFYIARVNKFTYLKINKISSNFLGKVGFQNSSLM